jgi:anti-anti-sigma regulatory factor
VRIPSLAAFLLSRSVNPREKIVAIKKEYLEDVVVLEPAHILVGSDETEELEAEILRLLFSGKKKIGLDLTGTRLMNTKAMKMLEKVHKRAEERGAALCLCNIDKRIERPLVVLQLTRLLNVAGTREECVAELDKLQRNSESA